MVVMKIFAALQLPPPVSGLTVVNKSMLQRFSDRGMAVTVSNTAPSEGSTGVLKILSRLERAIATIFFMVISRLHGVRHLYMPCDGGLGIAVNISIVLAARFLRFKVALHHHSFSYINDRSKLMAAFIRCGPKKVEHIFLCQDMQEGMLKQYPAAWKERQCVGKVLSNAFMVDEANLAEPRFDPSDQLTMGHLSNLTADKGAVRFIEMFLELRRSGVPARARMAGPICDEATQEAVLRAEREAPKMFEWLGPVYGDQKSEFYRSIDVFVFPSLYRNEAQPVVLLEAAAYGLPILATRRGCMGCDYSDFPGLVADDHDFEARSLEWLRAYDVKDRQAFFISSRQRFRDMKLKANYALSGILSGN